MEFWQWIWTIFFWFMFFAFLMVLFSIFADLFRDDELSGWAKAGWVLILILFTPLAALIYLIARGQGMQRRGIEKMQAAQAQQADYIRTVAAQSSSGASPTEQVAHAKQLLDSGAITPQEYETLKAKAFA